jgi:hypothetical protein
MPQATEEQAQSGERQEPWNKGKTREEWAEWQSKHDRLQGQFNQLQGYVNQLAAQKQQADQELAQYRLLRQTEGLPEDQRTLAILQEQARQASQMAAEADRRMRARDAEVDVILGQTGRRLKAEELVRTKGLDATIETPDGEMDTVDYLMLHRESKDVPGMTSVADRISEKKKKASDPKAATAKAPTNSGQPSKFLSGAGASAGGGRVKAVENTPANRERADDLLRRGYPYQQLALKGYIPEGYTPNQR